MRKYFLLSAVALMVATTANATTDYAEVTAKATIEVAGTFSCSNLNFGTIVVKQNNADTMVWADSYDGFEDEPLSTDVISQTGVSTAYCSKLHDNDIHDVSYPTTFSLTGGGSTLTATISYDSANGEFDGSLSIPAQVKAGEYTGSFTVTYTY